MEKLSKQEQVFVKEIALTDNATRAVKKAYKDNDYTEGYARVKGSELLTNPNITTAIQEVKRTLAERIPDELLERVQLEGLQASRTIKTAEDTIVEPDYAVRHKYLDSAYKIKGAYAPEKHMNLDINVDITNPNALALAEEYEKKLKEEL